MISDWGLCHISRDLKDLNHFFTELGLRLELRLRLRLGFNLISRLILSLGISIKKMIVSRKCEMRRGRRERVF